MSLKPNLGKLYALAGWVALGACTDNDQAAQYVTATAEIGEVWGFVPARGQVAADNTLIRSRRV